MVVAGAKTTHLKRKLMIDRQVNLRFYRSLNKKYKSFCSFYAPGRWMAGAGVLQSVVEKNGLSVNATSWKIRFPRMMNTTNGRKYMKGCKELVTRAYKYHNNVFHIFSSYFVFIAKRKFFYYIFTR